MKKNLKVNLKIFAANDNENSEVGKRLFFLHQNHELPIENYYYYYS